MKSKNIEHKEPIKVIDGIKFYLVEAADEIAHTRFMNAEIQDIYLRAGISESFLKEIAELMIKISLQPKSLQKLQEDVFTIAQNLKGRLGMIAEKKMYIQMACTLVLMEGEPMEWDQEWQNKKIKIWKDANELDFFLSLVFRHTRGLKDILMSDILAVWQVVQERISQLPTLTNMSGNS